MTWFFAVCAGLGVVLLIGVVGNLNKIATTLEYLLAAMAQQYEQEVEEMAKKN